MYQINRGTGAGGSNTNKYGLAYENKTKLVVKILKRNKHHSIIQICDKEYVFTKKTHFLKYMKQQLEKDIPLAHGCKQPDECYIDEEQKICFILEKKFQRVSGSVCEKIQTPDFKTWQYRRMIPNYRIVYMYSLSDWFKDNCVAEIEYLKTKNIPYFWGDDENYEQKLFSFIRNYSL